MLQANGKVLIGGEFTMAGGLTRNRIARFENDPATGSLTVTSPDRIQWLRGGTSPETHQVTFEFSPNDGGAWTEPVAGTRIAGGWELSGIKLPSSGRVRARARIIGGYGNGSSGIEEAEASLTISPLQLWRFTHFETYENTGVAADNADPDNDGLENLVEYAFELDPGIPDAAFLPQWQRDDDDVVLTFTRPTNVTGLGYIAEESLTMAPGTWTAIPNLGSPPLYLYAVPAGGPVRRFLRLRVTSP
jgi:hypothetical protein